MVEQAPPLSRHDLEAKIVKRCWQDEAFCKEFTADPAGAFVRYLEVPAAELPKIFIHEEKPGSWHIVLPAKPAYAKELSEEDLERVAGASNYLFEIGYQTAVQASRTALKSAASAITAAAVVVASAAVSVEKTIGW